MKNKKSLHYYKGYSTLVLKFDEHIKAITSKVSKTIGLLQKMNNHVRRSSHAKICISFIRSHLDYGEVIFDK